MPSAPAADGFPRGNSIQPSGGRLEAVYVLEDRPLPLPADAAHRDVKGFRLGGISDLHFSGTAVDPSGTGTALRFWAITDRGPNGVASRSMTRGQAPVEFRTLPVPAFAPLIVELVAEPPPPGRSAGVLRLERTIPIVAPTGRPASGRPIPTPNVSTPMVDPTTFQPLPADPYGFDSEGLVRMRDGRFWIAEEYAPSLAEISADGRLVSRYVPRGMRFESGDAVVQDVLPAAYARRKDNRGFESLAVSPDESLVFAMLQSPLAPGQTSEAIDPAGTVRLLAFDTTGSRPVAEYSYPLGAPGESGPGTRGRPCPSGATRAAGEQTARRRSPAAARSVATRHLTGTSRSAGCAGGSETRGSGGAR